MTPQYGALRPTSGWDRSGSLGHPSSFQWLSHLGSVTVATSLNGSQPNFARCLAVTWAGTLHIHFQGFLPRYGILSGAKFTLRPSLALSYFGSITARHSYSRRQPNFAALSTGHHLYLAGWPSCWALAHILVVYQMTTGKGSTIQVMSFCDTVTLLAHHNGHVLGRVLTEVRDLLIKTWQWDCTGMNIPMTNVKHQVQQPLAGWWSFVYIPLGIDSCWSNVLWDAIRCESITVADHTEAIAGLALCNVNMNYCTDINIITDRHTMTMQRQTFIHNKSEPRIERVQALADILHSLPCCYSNETRAQIANPPNSAQLDITPTIPHAVPVVWECG